jgi:hypothetical protein
VQYDDVEAIDVAFRSILSDLMGKCLQCNIQAEYHDMLTHNCNSDTNINSNEGNEEKKDHSTIGIQTTPSTSFINPKRSMTSPLDKIEEKLHTQLTKRKLNFAQGSDVISCRTGGQPLVLMKVRKARKGTDTAKSPLK